MDKYKWLRIRLMAKRAPLDGLCEAIIQESHEQTNMFIANYKSLLKRQKYSATGFDHPDNANKLKIFYVYLGIYYYLTVYMAELDKSNSSTKRAKQFSADLRTLLRGRCKEHLVNKHYYATKTPFDLTDQDLDKAYAKFAKGVPSETWWQGLETLLLKNLKDSITGVEYELFEYSSWSPDWGYERDGSIQALTKTFRLTLGATNGRYKDTALADWVEEPLKSYIRADDI